MDEHGFIICPRHRVGHHINNRCGFCQERTARDGYEVVTNIVRRRGTMAAELYYSLSESARESLRQMFDREGWMYYHDQQRFESPSYRGQVEPLVTWNSTDTVYFEERPF